MPLSALAPDQRAVVQLVLQQERSYDDLAGMLGISPDAVRDRARAGLDQLADAGGLTASERGDLADYLLGQQSVSKRELVRALLASSPDARDWAAEVVDELAQAWPDVVLPEVPADLPTSAAPTGAAVADEPEDEDFGFEDDDEINDGPGAVVSEPGAPAPAATAPRPRPRPEARRGAATLPDSARADRPRSSLFGGALLIGGLAIVLAALLIWLFSMGGDDEDDPAGGTSATPTATASATPQPAAAVELKSTTGGKAKGQLVLFVDDKNNVTFQIAAQDVPPSKDAEAYAVWLTGGDRPHRLGFAPTVGKDGVLATLRPARRRRPALPAVVHAGQERRHLARDDRRRQGARRRHHARHDRSHRDRRRRLRRLSRRGHRVRRASARAAPQRPHPVPRAVHDAADALVA